MIVRAKTKFRLLILLASVVLLIGAAATAYVVRKRHVRQFFAARRAEGMTSYKNADYANAFKNLGQYIRRDDGAQDAEALYAFAEARKHIESPDGKHLRDAMTMLQRVLAIDSASNIGGARREDIQRELLDLYTQLGYNNEAIDLAKALLDKNPNDLQALRAKARGLAATQQSEEALKICQSLNSTGPLDLDTQILSLQVLRDLRRRPEILTQAVDLLKKYPKDGKVELIASIGFTLIDEIPQDQRDILIPLIRERYPKDVHEKTDVLPPGEKNLEEWETYRFSHLFAYQAAKHDLSDLIFVRYLIEQLDNTRLPRQSLAVLQKVDAQQQIPWVRNLLIRRLWEAGKYDLALKRLEGLSLKGANPFEVEMLGMRGIAEAQSNLPGAAAATAKILANLKDDRAAQAWSIIINELYLKTKGDTLQVIEAINLALEMQRTNSSLRFFMGLAYLQLDDRDSAYEAISQVVKPRPLWQLPLIHLSRLQLEAGQLQSAYEEASEALYISPTLAAASNWAIIKAARIDSDAENITLLKFVSDIQKDFPNEESTLPVYVQLLARTNQVDQAKAVINDSLSSKKPPSVATLLQLANESRAANLGLEESLLAAAEKSGLTPEIAYARAIMMAQAGNKAEAVKYLQDCMPKAGAADVSWRLALATFFEQIKDNRAAAIWVALGDDPALKTNLDVQKQALAAASVQKDTEFLKRTLDRIRAGSPQQSIGWKMAQARMDLRDPSNANTPEVVKRLTEIVTSAPSNIDAHLLLAAAHEKNRNIPGAIEQLLAARKLQPSAQGVNLDLARLYTVQKDFLRASEILGAVTVTSLGPAQARVAAHLSAQQGDITKAIEFMKVAQADAPPLDRLYLAELYRRLNRSAEAEAIYKSLLEKPEQIEVIMAAADFFASHGRKDLASKALANLDKLSLKPGEKDFVLAQYSTHFDDGSDALVRYRAVVEQNPREFLGRRGLVNEYIRLGKPDQAVEAAKEAILALKGLAGDPGKPFQNVIDSAPSLTALTSQKGPVGLMMSLVEPSPNGEAAAKSLPIIVKAIATKAPPLELAKQLREIADAAPGLAELQIVLVQKYLEADQPEDAATIALRSLGISPASPELARNAALAITATGRYADALTAAQQWATLTPENPLRADAVIAQLHLNLNDHASALRQLKPYFADAKANPTNPDLALVNAVWAKALVMRGDDTAAWDLLAPLLADQPTMRLIWRQLVELLPNPQADKWLTRLAAVTPPDDVEENINLAFAWSGLYAGRAPRFKAGSGDPRHLKNAVAIVEHLAAIAPNNPTVVQSRAMLAQTENRTADAEREYLRALELNPNLAFSLNNLAMMVCDRGDLKEALLLAKRAVAAAPREATILDTLAYVQLKMKDYPGAQKNLLAAVSLQPQEIHWRIKLAQVYDEAGRLEELAKLLDEIESMTPGAKVSETDLQTIRQLRSKLPAKTAQR